MFNAVTQATFAPLTALPQPGSANFQAIYDGDDPSGDTPQYAPMRGDDQMSDGPDDDDDMRDDQPDDDDMDDDDIDDSEEIDPESRGELPDSYQPRTNPETPRVMQVSN